MLTASGRQSAVGVVVCRLFACLADRDDSPFHVICEQLQNQTHCLSEIVILLIHNKIENIVFSEIVILLIHYKIEHVVFQKLLFF